MPRPEPVPLHQIPLADLMAAAPHTPEYEASIRAAIEDPAYTDENIPYNPVKHLMSTVKKLGLKAQARPGIAPGFLIAADLSRSVLAAFDEVTGKLAGGFERKGLFVLPGYRGKGLGPEMIIRAFETGLLHPKEMNVRNSLTLAGRANRRKAHRLAVERALDAGIVVPEAVLEDYPDLVSPALRM